MQTTRKHTAPPPAPIRTTSLAPMALSPVTAIEPKEPRPPVAPVARPSHEEIAKAAYLRWLKEGGDPNANWLEAERSLMTPKPRG